MDGCPNAILGLDDAAYDHTTRRTSGQRRTQQLLNLSDGRLNENRGASGSIHLMSVTGPVASASRKLRRSLQALCDIMMVSGFAAVISS